MVCSCQYIHWLISLNFFPMKADCISHTDQVSYFETNNTKEWSAWVKWKECQSDDCSTLPSMRTRSCIFCSETNNLLCVETVSNKCFSFDFKRSQPSSGACRTLSLCEEKVNCSRRRSSRKSNVSGYHIKEKIECQIRSNEGDSHLLILLSVLVPTVSFIFVALLCTFCCLRRRNCSVAQRDNLPMNLQSSHTLHTTTKS